jgi:hypothetical protein
MIKLLSALPNALLVAQEGYTLLTTGISEKRARSLLQANRWESFVGHASTAALFSERLGMPIAYNRVNVTLDYPDCLVVGLFTPPHRLEEGQRWSEQEILAMPINWVLVQKHPSESVQIVSPDNNYQPAPVLWS